MHQWEYGHAYLNAAGNFFITRKQSIYNQPSSAIYNQLLQNKTGHPIFASVKLIGKKVVKPRRGFSASGLRCSFDQ